MDAALYDAPGVSTPYNWIKDIGGPAHPNSLDSIQAASGGDPNVNKVYSFWFTLKNVYDAQVTADQNAATAMVFNQMGVMGGPLKNSDGTPNVGGVLTINLLSEIPFVTTDYTQVAQVVIDLTTWVPGQFYWSDPLPNPVSVWGSVVSPSSTLNYVFVIQFICTTPYSFYFQRPCVLRNGSQWGSEPYSPGHGIFAPNNDHLCFAGPVDLTLVSYKDLGTANLTPDFAFSSQLQHTGILASALAPQIRLTGRPRAVGVFDSSNLAVEPILYAKSMAGGPLWKPSKLCTG